MTIFDKCSSFTTARLLQAEGIYSYFTPIQASTATEVRVDGEWKIMVGSNNYLGLTHHPRIFEAQRRALEKYGSGATGSRFLNGTIDLHDELEQRFATFFRKDAAVVFTTGYQASLGAVSTFVGRDDHLFLDKLDHASIVDGARMAIGKVHRYPHGDFESLARQLASVPPGSGKLVVTDGVFSMEGSIADLPRLVAITHEHGAALLIDDAHSLGVLGENGAGTARHFGVDGQVDLIMATFSKSLASVGGVVAGPAQAIHYLRHLSRSLMFTASAPPASVAGVLAALDVMEQEPERRDRLWENTRRVAEGLRSLGFDTGASETPIIPVFIGDPFQAARFWRALFNLGVFAHPIMPPAVPANASRIRVSMSAEHTDEQIEQVLDAFASVARKVPVSWNGKGVAERR
jgi:8-amino-7-oxononanoate synthase